jgi:hypothetical protein
VPDKATRAASNGWEMVKREQGSGGACKGITHAEYVGALGPSNLMGPGVMPSEAGPGASSCLL